MILVLSPHLDDAVMSLGGLLHLLRQHGERILIRTIMAGDPPANLPDTPLIHDLHQRWGAGENPMVMRRVEDERAATILDVQVEHLNWADCPYRTDINGNALYPNNNDLFGTVHPDDPVLNMQMDIPAEITQIIAPLGAGNHVDHQLIRDIILKLETDLPIWCYTEYPYGAESGEGRKISHDPSKQPIGKLAVDQALSAFTEMPIPLTVLISEMNLEAKIEAMACYESQISTFWDSIEDMKVKARAYAQALGTINHLYAEQLWIRRK